jgi:hypothetical protein
MIQWQKKLLALTLTPELVDDKIPLQRSLIREKQKKPQTRIQF